MAVHQPGQDVGEVGGRIDVVEFAVFDESGQDRPVMSALVGAGEECVFAIERNRRVILPISGKKQRFITGGMRCTGVGSAAFTVSGDPGLRSWLLRRNEALRLSWRHGCSTRRLVRAWRLAPLGFPWKR